MINSETVGAWGTFRGTESTDQGNDSELIPTMKMETRLETRPRFIFAVSFRRSVIIAEFWRSEVARTPKAKAKLLGVRKFWCGVWRAGE